MRGRSMEEESKKDSVYRDPMKITLIYLILGALWIILSDRAVQAVFKDADALSTMQTIKGWFYIIITSILLFFLIYINVIKERKAQNKLKKETERTRFYMDLLGHDMGNIHQGLKMSIQILKSKDEDPQLRNTLIKGMETQLNRSLDLARNVRTLSKIEGRKVKLEKIDITPLVKSAMRKARSSFPKRKVHIELSVPRSPLTVMAEPILEEVYFNLMHNAIKAQEKDPAWIGIEVRLDRDERIVTVSVSDKGPGLPSRAKEELLSELGKRESSRKGGLGLQLCKLLLDRYHGNLSVKDRIEGDHSGGAKFVTKVPYHSS